MRLRGVALEVAAWIPVGIIPILNGAVRLGSYGRWLGEPRASAISTALDVTLISAWALLVERRRPAAGLGGALRRGLLWLALTTLDHFGLGVFVFAIPVAALAAKYDLRAGELWGLVSLAILAAPAFVRRMAPRPERRGGRVERA